ncbi:MAG: hypothetical protein AB7S50_15520 [Bacteroidales bacterium]
MKQKLLIALIFIGLISCNSSKQTVKEPQEIKLDQIRKVIQKTGFVKLPLIFDANSDNSLKSNYDVDFKSNDSLIFESDIWSIIGFLPDTTDYYAVLFHSVGDMLYPTIMTIDKNGNKIDRQIICTGGCAGHAAVDISSCYDSIWIESDLKIKSISKVIGTVETEDSIPQTLNICNMRILDGLIEKNGKIRLKDSDLIDCN